MVSSKKILLVTVMASAAFVAGFGIASAATVDKVTAGMYSNEAYVYVSDVVLGDNLACTIFEDGYAVGSVVTKAEGPKVRLTAMVDFAEVGDVTALCNHTVPFGAGVR